MTNIVTKMVADANTDPVVRRRAEFVNIEFGLGIGADEWRVKIDHGEVSATPLATNDAPVAFHLRAANDAWDDFVKPLPPPGTHDILALFEGGRLEITGEALPLMQNLMAVKAVLEKMRQGGAC